MKNSLISFTNGFLTVLGVLFIAVMVLNILEQFEKTYLARAKYRAFVSDSCEPAHPGQLAIARIDERGKLNCLIQENVGYGKAPRIVSAAVMELPE